MGCFDIVEHIDEQIRLCIDDPDGFGGHGCVIERVLIFLEMRLAIHRPTAHPDMPYNTISTRWRDHARSYGMSPLQEVTISSAALMGAVQEFARLTCAWMKRPDRETPESFVS